MIVQAMPYPASAGFTPASIAGLSFWYDIQDLSTMFQDTAAATPAAVGQPVGRVNDKSGNGYTLLRVADAGRPILRQTGVGGYYYLEFDGADDSLIHTGTNIPCGTAIAVAMIEGSALGSDPSCGLLTNRTDQGSGVDLVFARNASTASWLALQGSGLGLFDSSHVWINQVQTLNYTVQATQVHSCDGTGHAGPLQLPTGISIGSDRQIGGRHLAGRAYEIFAYDSVLSTINRQAAEDYAGARYGIF